MKSADSVDNKRWEGKTQSESCVEWRTKAEREEGTCREKAIKIWQTANVPFPEDLPLFCMQTDREFEIPLHTHTDTGTNQSFHNSYPVSFHLAVSL